MSTNEKPTPVVITQESLKRIDYCVCGGILHRQRTSNPTFLCDFCHSVTTEPDRTEIVERTKKTH